MGYVEVRSVSRETLIDCVSVFPEAFRLLRRAAHFLALRRHVIEAARAKRATEQRSLKRSGDTLSSIDGDILDKVHHASTKLTASQATSVRMAVELEGNREYDFGESSPAPRSAIAEAAKETTVKKIEEVVAVALEPMREEIRQLHAQQVLLSQSSLAMQAGVERLLQRLNAPTPFLGQASDAQLAPEWEDSTTASQHGSGA